MTHRTKRAFTLVELLVVIAITSILMGLLFYPMFQAFRFTQRVQSQAQAQDGARSGVEKIQRELSQAAFVFDNANTATVIPLNRTVNYDGAPTSRPPVLFVRLDAILPDRASTPTTGDPIDPTTGKPISGGTIRFPLAPGTRVVRYFLGLQDNTKPYSNLYEFRGEDASFNPVLLYRAEFDPSDPNLVKPGVADAAPGGFNDPEFFYRGLPTSSGVPASEIAPNGQPYGANWRKLVSPVLSGPRLDMLAWRKDGAGELMPDLPFRTLALFSPASVPGDTTKPGFLTAGNAEAPGAPPTLYTTQYGQWTTPFSLTFLRSASTGGSGNEGEIKFTFEVDATAPPAQRLRVRTDGGTGTLATANNEVYSAFLASTGQIFVKTPRLTFAVDPVRGRIETGFPPLAGTTAGAPLFYPSGSNAPVAMSQTLFPAINRGDLVPTAFRVNTRDPRADGLSVKLDQGLMGVDLMETTALRYYVDPGTLPVAVPAPAAVGDFSSPLRIFGNVDGAGNVQSFGGILVSPGTERVYGPEIPLTVSPQLLPYNRTTDTLNGEVSALQKQPASITAAIYAPVTGKRTYDIDQIHEIPQAKLSFDTGDRHDLKADNPAWAGLIGSGQLGFAVPNDSPGIPAAQAADPNQREIRATYLWQNNYARDNFGHPLNADDSRADLGTFKPEADVVKAEYQTRSLLNVQVGARVYDANVPVPTTIQFSDKVKIGNATR